MKALAANAAPSNLQSDLLYRASINSKADLELRRLQVNVLRVVGKEGEYVVGWAVERRGARGVRSRARPKKPKPEDGLFAATPEVYEKQGRFAG